LCLPEKVHSIREENHVALTTTPECTVKTQTLLVSVFALVLLEACGSSTDPIASNCDLPTIFPASILVSVVDSVSNTPIGNGVTATAVDGRYFDASTNPDLPNYAQSSIALGDGRTGKYDVYVSKVGYRPWASYGVVVKAGACGTERTKITAKLQLRLGVA
jgi:hypothetical protein